MVCRNNNMAKFFVFCWDFSKIHKGAARAMYLNPVHCQVEPRSFYGLNRWKRYPSINPTDVPVWQVCSMVETAYQCGLFLTVWSLCALLGTQNSKSRPLASASPWEQRRVPPLAYCIITGPSHRQFAGTAVTAPRREHVVDFSLLHRARAATAR